jgi:MFS family permease
MAATQLMLLVGAWVGLTASRRAKNEQQLLCWTLALAGVGIATTVIMPGVGTALSVFLAHEVFRGAYQPVKDTYLNEQIPRGDSRRATILSFESLARHAGGIVGLLISGAVAQLISPQWAWISSGALLVGAVIWVRRKS